MNLTVFNIHKRFRYNTTIRVVYNTNSQKKTMSVVRCVNKLQTFEAKKNRVQIYYVRSESSACRQRHFGCVENVEIFLFLHKTDSVYYIYQPKRHKKNNLFAF